VTLTTLDPRDPDPALIARELLDVMSRLIRRLRAEHGLSLSQGAVLRRLDRDGPQSVSDLAAAERVRPQSMAQTVADMEGAGLVGRRPDVRDRRRALVRLTLAGNDALEAERNRREGWLARAIATELSAAQQAALPDVVVLLERLADRES
jgi:DNA-binding MarR family transcriptional regulator